MWGNVESEVCHPNSNALILFLYQRGITSQGCLFSFWLRCLCTPQCSACHQHKEARTSSSVNGCASSVAAPVHPSSPHRPRCSRNVSGRTFPGMSARLLIAPSTSIRSLCVLWSTDARGPGVGDSGKEKNNIYAPFRPADANAVISSGYLSSTRHNCSRSSLQKEKAAVGRTIPFDKKKKLSGMDVAESCCL